jgi:glycosyltransferase involved in cell wall biosynthesis
MIVIVCGTVPPEHSGAGKCILDFYEYLKTNEYEVRLVTHTLLDNDDDAFVINKLQSRIPGKISLVIDFLESFFLLAGRFIFERPSKNDVKVVWLVSCQPLTFAAAIVFYLLGYRIITQNTLLGSDDPVYKYPGDILNIKYKLKRLQYYLSDCIACISPVLYHFSRKEHRNCVMLPYPVDQKYQVKQPFFNKTQSRENVLFVGKLSVRKGADIVLSAINLVHKTNPSVRFTLVGPRDETDNEMALLFNSLDHINEDKVDFAGFQLDPSPYFAKTDIFFMPSRREGFGIVFIEAMASGLPVVARKLTGITDYIFGDDYPTILDTEDPESYANTILSLVNNKDLYVQLSKQGLELVKRFEREEIYHGYLRLLTK